MSSLAEIFASRRQDDLPGCTFEDRTIPWTKVVNESATRAAILRSSLDPSQALRIGVHLANSAEFIFWLGAALLTGTTILAYDQQIAVLTDALVANCQLLVSAGAGVRRRHDGGHSGFSRLDIESADYLRLLDSYSDSGVSTEGAQEESAPISIIRSVDSSAQDLSMHTVLRVADDVISRCDLSHRDVLYNPVPLSRDVALLACWVPAVVTGAEVVLTNDSTGDAFMREVIEYNCTSFVYDEMTVPRLLGRLPARVDEDHRLRVGLGIGSTVHERTELTDRLGCEILDIGEWPPTPTSAE